MKYLLGFIILFFAFESRAQSSCLGTPGQITWKYWGDYTSFPDTLDLFSNDNYPNNPSGQQVMGSTQSPINYADNFGGMMRGFIKVPATATYQFNVTGDDRTIFFLSTNDLPQNKIKRAFTTNYTGLTDFNAQATQKSGAITLNGGQYYYFEMFGFEGGGGDHMTLYWRKTTNADTTWRIIDYTFLTDFGCNVTCAPRGTVCNDGNPATTNDQADGHCNCVGVAPTTNPCVGARGVAEAYYFDNINGSAVEPDLIASPNFPLIPNRKEQLNGAYGPLAPSTRDNYGTLVQGFLTVPVTGNYEFNLTGDGQTFFFMSRNDSLEYKQNSQALVIWGVDDTEFNASTFQKIGPLYLEKGKYYYYEFRHKESTWRDHFVLHWKTPFHTHKHWKRVPKFYLFDYQCELSCIAQGTPCNDNNAFTNNDQIDANCNCIGTPCTAPNCQDASANFVAYDPAASTKNLVPNQAYAWESCSSASNPNSARNAYQKWIRYDLGDVYQMQGSRFWNYNVAGQTNKGFRDVVFDYSVDGVTWVPLPGVYTWAQASGQSDYAGFAGPTFNNQKIRYILISAVNNHGNATCWGFSKATFDLQLCNPTGTACDDENPLTIHDQFDANCNCKGVQINCSSDSLKLGGYSLTNATYEAGKNIESISDVDATQNVSFTAGNSIVFLPGFEVKSTGIFKAEIKNCLQAAFIANEQANKQRQIEKVGNTLVSSDLVNNKLKKIIFLVAEPTKVTLKITNAKGTLVSIIMDEVVQVTGTQVKYLPINRLAKGKYFIELTMKGQLMKEELLVD